ncbi:ImmA/IrrE family metallo-endopeptidase [Cronobacter turicensis]|nr:ImmA/IrrE family metallo-endopeptidase [Cronobacter turicensis]ELY4131560.1 ImmA/IrrE family metallo-endopeptidase [Cronobacter turicensis]ELY4349449.1 ImmA/IrrE family metallo-endopeptidase [Cronobacter turicensis]ELY6277935.1 ImmA/IrrE family metallo-endopeptidase [Cronobacter turicensis]
MAKLAPSPNPSILRWAREKAGLSQEEAARRLSLRPSKKETNLIAEFEKGSSVPTPKKLIEIAKLYRRPLITFYLEKPPVEAPKGEDFRTLHGSGLHEENPTLDALIRDVYVRQNIVKEALFDAEVAIKNPIVNSITLDKKIGYCSEKIISECEISLTEYRAERDAHEAFNYLRKKIESKGIYVLLMGNLGSHHSNIPVEVFRGFTISDAYAPFIIINDNDSKYAWSFTLLHELVHIFLGASGISGTFSENKIEKFCNDVASNILLSEKAFDSLDIYEDIELDKIIDIASSKSNEMNISASMITYRAFSRGLITHDEWQETAKHFRDLWKKNKENAEKSRGTYYVTKRHKTGNALITTVKRSILDGVMSQTKAGKVLGVKPGNVAEMVGL